MEDLEISILRCTRVKIKDCIKASAEEKVGILETHRNKLWFDQKSSEFSSKRKQTILETHRNKPWFDQKSSELSTERKRTILETHRNKPWFDQKSSELSTKRKQTIFLWSKNPNYQTADDLTNIKQGIFRTFKKKKLDYMTAKVKWHRT